MKTALAGLVILAGCGCGAAGGGAGSPDASPDAAISAGADSAVAAADSDVATAGAPLGPPPGQLAVHEWATFTVFHTVADQKYVAGVQRHEEQLPDFVHARSLGPKGSGAAEPLAAPVMAKVQTAGLFFSAALAGEIRVTVQQPQGAMVGDWPPADSASPPVGQAGQLVDGKATWRLRVEPQSSLPLPTAATDSLWQPLRQAGGAQVWPSAKPEHRENFLFHRGLARFAPPVRVKVTPSQWGVGFDTQVFNDGDEPIANAYLLHLHAGGGLLQEIHDVPAKGDRLKSTTPKEAPQWYYQQVKDTLATLLQNQGLTAAESKALVETFTYNWLKTYGLRLIVLAPPGWGQQWLPTAIEPKPQSHVRVMLGRIELLTPQDEAALLAQVQDAAKKQDLGVLAGFGFFAEPKARRMAALVADPATQAFCNQLIDAAAAQTEWK